MFRLIDNPYLKYKKCMDYASSRIEKNVSKGFNMAIAYCICNLYVEQQNLLLEFFSCN